MVSSKQLVLITDAIPQRNGAGISQTLYNLFLAYPESITVICEKDENVSDRTSSLPCAVLIYAANRIKPVTNRLGRYLNPLFATINHEWLATAPINKNILSLKDTSIVVVSTNVEHKLIFGWKLLQAGFTVVPYFMDDWMDGNNTCWKSGSIQQIVADLLRKAPARLMISYNLQQTLEQRYQLPAAPTSIVHNPSPPLIDVLPLGDAGGQTHSHTSFPPTGGTKGGTHTSSPVSGVAGGVIIYAGSIWPMHADALIAVAKAIHMLNASGKNDFSLCIYTSHVHWGKYKSILQGEGVHWGGWLPYDEVRQKFAAAFLLLCTASFDKAYRAYTNSSVQTKLTDYIAAGKPLLVVAPQGAASGEWVQNENCGYWMQTKEPEEIATLLQNLAGQPEDWEQKAQKAIELASTKYSTPAVQQGLYQFLEAHG